MVVQLLQPLIRLLAQEPQHPLPLGPQHQHLEQHQPQKPQLPIDLVGWPQVEQAARLLHCREEQHQQRQDYQTAHGGFRQLQKLKQHHGDKDCHF